MSWSMHPFDWVMENLMRNSLDAMDGTGTIKAEIYRDDDPDLYRLVWYG